MDPPSFGDLRPLGRTVYVRVAQILAMRCFQPIVVRNQQLGCEVQPMSFGSIGDSFGDPKVRGPPGS
jgi:hypothetical protein